MARIPTSCADWLRRLRDIGGGALLAGLLVSSVFAQTRPYAGYAYPAGGQQGTTFVVKLGGQGLDDVNRLLFTGTGVTGRVVNYYRRLNPQEMQLLNEQLKELKRSTSAVPRPSPEDNQALAQRIEQRTREYVPTPACASLAALVFVEVSIAPDASPGARELRLVTPKGISNPLTFHVGQLPEHTRKPMITASLQVLGKEAAALRKSPAEEAEERVELPRTLNGQIASGEVNRYRFAARRGQRLVIATQARQLLPFVADAVPGWFQPILSLREAGGREVAFADDYRFQPDPVLLFEVPKDGEYVLSITDAIYRGREDFIYRISLGELPWITSLFPLGAKCGSSPSVRLHGWNLAEPKTLTPAATEPGSVNLIATNHGRLSNPVRFAWDAWPEKNEREPNGSFTNAQSLRLPVVVNGRMDEPGDRDVFQFTGQSNDLVAVEVQARRLDSPLDAFLELMDADGRILAFSDDREDLTAGLQTHQADPWLQVRLPATGTYFVRVHDTAEQSGREYGYRLRLSVPQPDFALRVVPSSLSLRTNASGTLTVYAQRREGFTNSIRVDLQEVPPGFSAATVKIPAGQNSARFTIKAPAQASPEPFRLAVLGRAKVGNREITRPAEPAEDRMQAFLWRQLVPAQDLPVLIFNPAQEPVPARHVPERPAAKVAPSLATTNTVTGTNAPPKFSKSQVTRRLRELKLLYEEGLLTDSFYLQKAEECEAIP